MKKQTCSFENDYFGKYYAQYSDFTDTSFRRNLNWFKGIFHVLNRFTNVQEGKNKTAIEFGCAHGAVSRILYDWGYNIIATDISNYAISRAKKLSPQIPFLRHDIQKPFLSQTGTYDLVVCLDVIEHLENPAQAIINMHDLVKPNGLVICSTPNDYPETRSVFTHINVKKPEQWRQLFHKAGFRNVIIRQLTLLPLLYRIHWRLNFAFPFGINIPFVCSPVFIFAKKQ